MVRSALGYWPDDYNYVWNPLAQPNELQIAQAAYQRAQKDMLYLQEGVIRPSQIQRNLQASEEYQFNDEDIEAQAATESELVERPDDVEPDNATDGLPFYEAYTMLSEKGLTHDEVMQQLAP